MRKVLMYLAILIVFSQTIFALETVFNDWLYSGQSVTVEGKTFIIYKSSTAKDIIADYSDGTLFITNNSCQQTGNVRICLDNIQYDLDVKEDKMKVRAVSLAPDITITRTIDDNEFDAGSGTVISVTIKNTGGLAENVTYTDIFTDNIEIDLANGLKKIENGVRWKANNLKTESVTFSYRIKVKSVIERSFVAKMTYYDGGKFKTLRTSAIKITTTPRLVQVLILKDTTSLIGELNNFTINFTNRETNTVDIDVNILIDPRIALTRIPREFKKVSDSLYHATLQMKKLNKTANATKTYKFFFKGLREGSYTIRTNVNYSTLDFKNRKLPELLKKIEIENKGVKVRTNLDDLEFESNQARTLRMWLQNLNPVATLKNIVVKMNGGGFVELPDTVINNLGIYEHEKIVEIDFFAPEVTSTKGFTIEANVSYDTQYGDNFSKRFIFTETVNAIGIMKITQSSTKTSMQSGDESTITVVVRNPRITKISKIVVKDNLSGDFQVFGRNSAVIQLEKTWEINHSL